MTRGESDMGKRQRYTSGEVSSRGADAKSENRGGQRKYIQLLATSIAETTVAYMSHDVGKGGHEDRLRMLSRLADVFGERRTPRVDRVMAHQFWTTDDWRESQSRPARRQPQVAQVIAMAERGACRCSEGVARGH
jgi:hypothetical protein